MTAPVPPAQPAPTTGPETTTPAAPAPEAAPAAPAAAPAAPAAPAQGTTPGPAPAPQSGSQPVEAAPPASQPLAETFPRSYVEELRGESQGYRNSRDAEKARADAAAAERDQALGLLKQFQELLDPNAGKEAAPDPAAIAAQLEQEKAARSASDTAAQAQIRQLQVQNAVPLAVQQYASTAEGAQLDLGLLNAVLTTNGTYANLDPASPTFQQDLMSALATARQANPGLVVQSTPTVQTTGTEPTGPSAASGQLTLEQYRALSPEEAVKAQSDGRLRTLLGG